MKKFLLCSILISSHALALTGREIMDKIKTKNQGYIGANAKMVMTLIDAHQNQVERIMESKVLEDKKDGDKSITEFTKPLDVKGTKLLSISSKEGSNKQWLYLPKFKRVKKINSSGQEGSFMGSEFSYEDIAGHPLDKYEFKVLKEDAQTWTVQAKPKEKSGYSKMVSTISKDKLNPLSVSYYDRKGELLKVSKIENFKEYKVGKNIFDVADKITMENKQTKKKSIIVWTHRKLGIKHKKNDFKSTKLK